MWTEKKFDTLPLNAKHKKAAELLRSIWKGGSISTYRNIEEWLALPKLNPEDLKDISDRFHMHLACAGRSLKEHNLLPLVNQGDAASKEPFLPIAIYLDHLRSAHNVGSIVRTTEALRLGSIYFSPSTPFIDNPKVQKTSMQTFNKVPCFQLSSLEELPRQLIALETTKNATSVFDFSFPQTFTLLLGNEEYGLSDAALEAADHFVQIPLPGSKNSLNVASAYAVAAACIRHKRDQPSFF